MNWKSVLAQFCLWSRSLQAMGCPLSASSHCLFHSFVSGNLLESALGRGTGLQCSPDECLQMHLPDQGESCIAHCSLLEASLPLPLLPSSTQKEPLFQILPPQIVHFRSAHQRTRLVYLLLGLGFCSAVLRPSSMVTCGNSCPVPHGYIYLLQIDISSPGCHFRPHE